MVIRRPTDRRRRLIRTTRAAEAIRERLGFTEIAKRERHAIASFEQERLTACQELMQTTAP